MSIYNDQSRSTHVNEYNESSDCSIQQDMHGWNINITEEQDLMSTGNNVNQQDFNFGHQESRDSDHLMKGKSNKKKGGFMQFFRQLKFEHRQGKELEKLEQKLKRFRTPT